MAVSECCLTKLRPYILFEKYINILALEMASPENRHCASCIGTLSFPIDTDSLRPNSRNRGQVRNCGLEAREDRSVMMPLRVGKGCRDCDLLRK